VFPYYYRIFVAHGSKKIFFNFGTGVENSNACQAIQVRIEGGYPPGLEPNQRVQWNKAMGGFKVINIAAATYGMPLNAVGQVTPFGA
jgi:hypothetical protein